MDCHRIATGWVAKSFSFRTADLGEGCLHDFSGACVGVREHVAVDVQSDCWGCVPYTAAYREDVEFRRYELGNVGMAETMQGATPLSKPCRRSRQSV